MIDGFIVFNQWGTIHVWNKYPEDYLNTQKVFK